MWSFLYVRSNSQEIWEEISFPFCRKELSSTFLGDSRLIISKTCVVTPTFLDGPCKDLLFPHGPNLAQKPLYLVGTSLPLIPLSAELQTVEVGEQLLFFVNFIRSTR